jgi:hypothetical protein
MRRDYLQYAANATFDRRSVAFLLIASLYDRFADHAVEVAEAASSRRS